MTKPPEQLGRLVDTPKKPQTSDEEEAAAPPVPAPSAAGSPFRPLSRRRRQAQLPEPPPAVERPSTSLVFDASPTTVAAALAKAGASTDEASLAWRAGRDGEADVKVEAHNGTGAPRGAAADAGIQADGGTRPGRDCVADVGIQADGGAGNGSPR